MHAFWDYVLSPVGWGVPGSCDLPPPTLESRARPWWSDVNEPNIKPHCHVVGIRYGNKKSESDYLKTLADRVFRPAGDSTHNSWQTHASLRLYTAATFVYLQRGGCSHCRHNDVTVTSRTDLCTDHSGCVNNEWADISAQRQYAAVQIYIHYWSHAFQSHDKNDQTFEGVPEGNLGVQPLISSSEFFSMVCVQKYCASFDALPL